MKRTRLRVVIRGAVQGVGFRPFVYRVANELGLHGWVSNSAQGVLIELEGANDKLQVLLVRLKSEKPRLASIHSLEATFLDPVGYSSFEIRESADTGAITALVLPDIATCADCLRDIMDPKDRRFLYPFTNCTNCGPRFSIVEALPYDRAHTSMKNFVMCAECEREYRDPSDRRFHAQPNACPRCGPQLELWNSSGEIVESKHDALLCAAAAIRAGKIVALKGLGGFQLIVDAGNQEAVAWLRDRKHREEKPFAVMFESIAAAKEHCAINELEKRLLLSPESPIVLLRTKSSVAFAAVAPGNPNLGVMLPYTPLHHLLMRELHFPIVATSGNLSDEPICIDEREAIRRLGGMADIFLVHNRPIVRHVDDSIARIMGGREMVLRRARGYAPLPIICKSPKRDAEPATILAVGAHLKNSVALQIGENIFVSQHIGDLETEQAYAAFKNAAKDLPQLYQVQPRWIACDLHPEYLSTKFAEEISTDTEIFPVQHHWAHIAACLAENEIEPPALGVAWDGTGLGLDGTIWGGEFLLAKGNSFKRVAHFRRFRLPGGDAAVKEPRRSALGLLYEIFGEELWQREDLALSFSKAESGTLRTMLMRNLNAPFTSSVGRLFDAVAALVGRRNRTSFEGQAAMELEFALPPDVTEAYPFHLTGSEPIVIDWQPTILAIMSDLKRDEDVGLISARFHNMLIEALVAVAQKVGENKVVLSGGCFQNRYLTERAVERLRAENFRPYWHQRVPPNDGGIALGQIAAANLALREERT